jgi:LysM repeat protein
MLQKNKKTGSWMLVFSLVVWLVSCRPEISGEISLQPSRTPLVHLTQYETPTPSATTSPFPTLFAAPVTPAPTPTPFSHLIVKGDTVLGISLQYGVSQENILAANPGVDPRFLKVGEPLIIPLEGEDWEPFNTPTPFPLSDHQPECYAAVDGNVWCFLLVENTREEALENISGWIGFADENGNVVESQAALPPLNRLPPGQNLPLVAQFSSQSQQYPYILGGLLSVLPVPPDDTRYLNAGVADLKVEIDDSEKLANVQGRVEIEGGGLSPRQIWAAAVAYSASGGVVGVRKVEVGQGCLTVAEVAGAEAGGQPTGDASVAVADECLEFNLVVFSAGPEIVRVEVLIEARPD